MENGPFMVPEERMPYQGLDAEVDLQGNLLRTSSRASGSVRSNGGKVNPGRGKKYKSNEWEGFRRSLKSATVHEIGDNARFRESEVQPRGQQSASVMVAGFDTRGNNLAVYIQG
ncbi:hypothetical protein TB1_035179 [Malus domestica]